MNINPSLNPFYGDPSQPSNPNFVIVQDWYNKNAADMVVCLTHPENHSLKINNLLHDINQLLPLINHFSINSKQYLSNLLHGKVTIGKQDKAELKMSFQIFHFLLKFDFQKTYDYFFKNESRIPFFDNFLLFNCFYYPNQPYLNEELCPPFKNITEVLCSNLLYQKKLGDLFLHHSAEISQFYFNFEAGLNQYPFLFFDLGQTYTLQCYSDINPKNFIQDIQRIYDKTGLSHLPVYKFQVMNHESLKAFANPYPFLKLAIITQTTDAKDLKPYLSFFTPQFFHNCLNDREFSLKKIGYDEIFNLFTSGSHVQEVVTELHSFRALYKALYLKNPQIVPVLHTEFIDNPQAILDHIFRELNKSTHSIPPQSFPIDNIFLLEYFFQRKDFFFKQIEKIFNKPSNPTIFSFINTFINATKFLVDYEGFFTSSEWKLLQNYVNSETHFVNFSQFFKDWLEKISSKQGKKITQKEFEECYRKATHSEVGEVNFLLKVKDYNPEDLQAHLEFFLLYLRYQPHKWQQVLPFSNYLKNLLILALLKPEAREEILSEPEQFNQILSDFEVDFSKVIGDFLLSHPRTLFYPLFSPILSNSSSFWKDIAENFKQWDEALEKGSYPSIVSIHGQLLYSEEQFIQLLVNSLQSIDCASYLFHIATVEPLNFQKNFPSSKISVHVQTQEIRLEQIDFLKIDYEIFKCFLNLQETGKAYINHLKYFVKKFYNRLMVTPESVFALPSNLDNFLVILLLLAEAFPDKTIFKSIDYQNTLTVEQNQGLLQQLIYNPSANFNSFLNISFLNYLYNLPNPQASSLILELKKESFCKNILNLIQLFPLIPTPATPFIDFINEFCCQYGMQVCSPNYLIHILTRLPPVHPIWNKYPQYALIQKLTDRIGVHNFYYEENNQVISTKYLGLLSSLIPTQRMINQEDIISRSIYFFGFDPQQNIPTFVSPLDLSIPNLRGLLAGSKSLVYDSFLKIMATIVPDQTLPSLISHLDARWSSLSVEQKNYTIRVVIYSLVVKCYKEKRKIDAQFPQYFFKFLKDLKDLKSFPPFEFKAYSEFIEVAKSYMIKVYDINDRSINHYMFEQPRFFTNINDTEFQILHQGLNELTKSHFLEEGISVTIATEPQLPADQIVLPQKILDRYIPRPPQQRITSIPSGNSQETHTASPILQGATVASANPKAPLKATEKSFPLANCFLEGTTKLKPIYFQMYAEFIQELESCILGNKEQLILQASALYQNNLTFKFTTTESMIAVMTSFLDKYIEHGKAALAILENAIEFFNIHYHASSIDYRTFGQSIKWYLSKVKSGTGVVIALIKHKSDSSPLPTKYTPLEKKISQEFVLALLKIKFQELRNFVNALGKGRTLDFDNKVFFLVTQNAEQIQLFSAKAIFERSQLKRLEQLILDEQLHYPIAPHYQVIMQNWQPHEGGFTLTLNQFEELKTLFEQHKDIILGQRNNSLEMSTFTNPNLIAPLKTKHQPTKSNTPFIRNISKKNVEKTENIEEEKINNLRINFDDSSITPKSSSEKKSKKRKIGEVNLEGTGIYKPTPEPALKKFKTTLGYDSHDVEMQENNQLHLDSKKIIPPQENVDDEAEFWSQYSTHTFQISYKAETQKVVTSLKKENLELIQFKTVEVLQGIMDVDKSILTTFPTFFPFQKQMIAKALNFMRAPVPASPIIAAQMGLGKTVIMAGIIEQLLLYPINHKNGVEPKFLVTTPASVVPQLQQEFVSIFNEIQLNAWNYLLQAKEISSTQLTILKVGIQEFIEINFLATFEVFQKSLKDKDQSDSAKDDLKASLRLLSLLVKHGKIDHNTSQNLTRKLFPYLKELVILLQQHIEKVYKIQSANIPHLEKKLLEAIQKFDLNLQNFAQFIQYCQKPVANDHKHALTILIGELYNFHFQNSLEPTHALDKLLSLVMTPLKISTELENTHITIISHNQFTKQDPNAIKERICFVDEAQRFHTKNSKGQEKLSRGDYLERFGKILGAGRMICVTGTPFENDFIETFNLLQGTNPFLAQNIGLVNGIIKAYEATTLDFLSTKQESTEKATSNLLKSFILFTQFAQQILRPFILVVNRENPEIQTEIGNALPKTLVIQRAVEIEQGLLDRISSILKPIKDSFTYQRKSRALLVHSSFDDAMSEHHNLINRVKNIQNLDEWIKDSAIITELLHTPEFHNCLEHKLSYIISVEFVALGNILKYVLNRKFPELDVKFYDGQLKLQQKEEIRTWFTKNQSEDNKKARILILSQGTGGVGLNLPADGMIDFSLSYNPGKEDQLRGRLTRLGSAIRVTENIQQIAQNMIIVPQFKIFDTLHKQLITEKKRLWMDFIFGSHTLQKSLTLLSQIVAKDAAVVKSNKDRNYEKTEKIIQEMEARRLEVVSAITPAQIEHIQELLKDYFADFSQLDEHILKPTGTTAITNNNNNNNANNTNTIANIIHSSNLTNESSEWGEYEKW